jgi:hypothetical protein
MLRSMASKVAWVGRTASMVFGLALVLALILGVASAALSATGGNFVLGKANEATSVSKLTATIAGPALTLVNQSTDAAATALNINVASGKAPMRVNAAAGTATNLSADELDGKDSSGFYAQGDKVTDSSHADLADSATSATSAADADTLDGKDSSAFQPSDPCPSGTLFHEGACIETISQGPAAFPNAEGTCLQAGRRLPTVAELQTFRLRQDLSGAEFTSQVWFDANGSSQAQKVMLVDKDGRQSVASGSAPFRCVAAPNAARSENNPLEAAAQSDLRKAVAAANLCYAGNDDSYANCGTIAQLEANGYQHDSNVTLMITTATSTRWVAQAQNDSGGSAYRFDTETGQIVPIPRF